MLSLEAVQPTLQAAPAVLLDPAPVVVSAQEGEENWPAVSWNGTNFLVTWLLYYYGSQDIYAARVSAGGSLLDTTPLPLAVAVELQNYPRVAWSGQDHLSVWTSNPSTNSSDVTLWGGRITPDGQLLDEGNNTRIMGNISAKHSLIWVGTHYILVYHDYLTGSGIYALRLDVEGKPMDLVPRQLVAPQAGSVVSYHHASWHGDRLGISWVEAGTYYSVWNTMIARDLSTLASPINVYTLVQSPGTSGFNNRISATRNAWVGGNYFIFWQGKQGVSPDSCCDSSLYGTLLNRDQSVKVPLFEIQAPGLNYWPNIASNGQEVLLLWNVDRAYNDNMGRNKIVAKRFDANGSSLDPTAFEVAGNMGGSVDSAVASGGNTFLTIFSDSDYSSGYQILYSMRVKTSDTPDRDADGWVDGFDNCIEIPNVDQTDLDLDGFGELCDCAPEDPELNETCESTGCTSRSAGQGPFPYLAALLVWLAPLSWMRRARRDRT